MHWIYKYPQFILGLNNKNNVCDDIVQSLTVLQPQYQDCVAVYSWLKPAKMGWRNRGWIWLSSMHWGHFAYSSFKCIFFNENVWSSIKISLKFVPKGPINNVTAMAQMTAWCRLGDKPLSGPLMVRLLTRICVTRLRWVKKHTKQSGWNFASNIFKHILWEKKSLLQRGKSALVQVMAWHWTGFKPLSELLKTQFIDAYMHRINAICWNKKNGWHFAN